MTTAEKPTILIVDDNPMNVQVMEEMLTAGDFEVRIVMKGSMALESAQQLKPSLIILDIDMPDADGRDICVDLTNHPDTANIPVILVSAYNDPSTMIEGYEAGAKDYIVKPVNADILRAKARIYVNAIWPS